MQSSNVMSRQVRQGVVRQHHHKSMTLTAVCLHGLVLRLGAHAQSSQTEKTAKWKDGTFWGKEKRPERAGNNANILVNN